MKSLNTHSKSATFTLLTNKLGDEAKLRKVSKSSATPPVPGDKFKKFVGQ